MFHHRSATQYRSSKEKKTAFAATLGEIANPGIQTGQLFTSPIPSTNGIGSATPAGVAGNGEVRSLGNNVTSIYGSVVKARADTTTASTKAVGGQQSGVRSTQVKC